MSKTRKLTIGILAVLGIMLVVSMVSYYFHFSRPKTILKTFLNQSYNLIHEKLDQSNKLDYEDKFSLNSAIKITTSENNALTAYNYNLDIKTDLANQKIYGNIAALKENQAILNAAILINNQDVFAQIPQIYTKTLNLGASEDLWSAQTGKSVTLSDYSYILKFFKDSFIQSLENSDFSKEHTNLIINKKEIKTDKLIYKADSKRLNQVSKIFLNNLKSDSKALEILAKLTLMDKEELLKEIENNISDISKEKELEINLYTKKHSSKVLKAVLIKDQENIFCYESLDNYLAFDYYNEARITVDQQQDQKVIKLYTNDYELATFNVTEYNANKISSNFIINYEQETIKGDFTFNSTKINDHEISTNLTININPDSNTEKINLKIDTKMSNNVSIEEFKNTDVINIDALTETDYEDINNNLLNNEFIMALLQEYYQLSSNSISF